MPLIQISCGFQAYSMISLTIFVGEAFEHETNRGVDFWAFMTLIQKMWFPNLFDDISHEFLEHAFGCDDVSKLVKLHDVTLRMTIVLK